MADTPSRASASAVIDRIVEPIRAEQERLQARKETLAAEMAALNAEIRVLNRVLSAAEPQESKLKKRASVTGNKMPAVAEERLELARPFLKKMDVITAPDLVDASRGKINRDQASKILFVLRERGEIRFTGNKKEPGQKGLGRKTYAIANG